MTAGTGRADIRLVDEYDKPILDNLTDPDPACETVKVFGVGRVSEA
jgi:hypothetical protein